MFVNGNVLLRLMTLFKGVIKGDDYHGSADVIISS